LVVKSFHRIKTTPPSTSTVCKQAGVVYAIGIFISTWYVLPVQWSPFHLAVTKQGDAKATFGSPEGGPFSPIVSMAIAFSVVIFPTGYVFFTGLRLWRKRLLPRSGRTRALSTFFLRIIVVFLVFYLPNTILSAILTKESDKSGPKVFWLEEARYLFASLQALTTLYMVSTKDDILAALAESRRRLIGNWLTDTFSVNFSSSIRTSVTISGLPAAISEWDQPDVYDDDDEDCIVNSDQADMRCNSTGSRICRAESGSSDVEQTA